RGVRESRRHPADALVDALRRDEGRRVRAEELNAPGQLWGPATQVMHSLLVHRGAQDWLNSEGIDALARAGGLGSPGGDLTVHHLFPRRVIGELYDNADLSNRPANYALLSRSTNSELGDRRPDEAHAILTPDQRKLAAAQFFGEAAGD